MLVVTVTVAQPDLWPYASPSLFTLNTDVLSDVTVSCVIALEPSTPSITIGSLNTCPVRTHITSVVNPTESGASSTCTTHSAVTRLPLWLSVDAVIVAVPSDTAVTTPFASTFAIPSSFDSYVTVPFSFAPNVALSWCIIPSPSSISSSLRWISVGFDTTVTRMLAVASLSYRLNVSVVSPFDTPLTFPYASTVAIDGFPIVNSPMPAMSTSRAVMYALLL